MAKETSARPAGPSRREFLKDVGTYGAAAGVGLAGGVGLAAQEVAAAQAVHPFGYPEGGLDVEETRRRGYDGFKGLSLPDGTQHSGCAFGAFNAIVGQLAEVVGAPYTAIPTQMMDWAGAGVVGFGTLCGTLNGAAAAIGLVCDRREARGFISDLLTWYSETP
ncbi:MAG TPA: C-GCAxxG-C-C family (seleno)protein, partial [Longimicrobiales bacterium]|nr:C-GCAxxG-C-C family (seleno)protein [Longimicrobiales bacterium]